jgi:uncharacterized glyoxalase superfamily protein PhnB
MSDEKVQVLGTVPVLPVTDVQEALAFYRDALGFECAFEQGQYAGVVRGDAQVHLDGVVNSGAGQMTVRVTVAGVDALYAEIEPKGVVDPAEPLNTKPWGARQFSVLDCCGNRITFVEGA